MERVARFERDFTDHLMEHVRDEKK